MTSYGYDSHQLNRRHRDFDTPAARVTSVSTPQPSVELTVKAFGITDKGRARPSNEDQFLIAELTKAMRIWQTSLPETKTQFGEEHGHLFLVADGMGGHRGGEQASTLAVVAIQQFTLNTLKWFFGTDSVEAKKVLAQFQTALTQADAAIVEEAAEKAGLKRGRHVGQHRRIEGVVPVAN